jgi:hypothetical protein
MHRSPKPRQGRAGVLALAGVLSLSLGAYQCPLVPAEIRFLAPVEGAALTHMPLSIELDWFVRADPESLLVELNGTDITHLFVLDPPSNPRQVAWADFVWDGAFVLPGPNQLQASILLDGIPRSAAVTFSTEGDPYADAVDSFAIGTSGGFGLAGLPDVVLGPPTGSGLFGGTLGVFSLGLLGEIVVEFDDNVIVDGPGVDFTVFENAFFGTGLFEIVDVLFAEAGTVSVSQDGLSWFTFACDDDLGDSPYYPGCAGVYPVLADGETDDRHPSVPTFSPPITSFIGQLKSAIPVPEGSGGDSFDLADVGLGWARYVRIEAADHVDGPFGPDNAGFDLDAVTAVNSLPATDANANGIPDALE